jgi:hypothetical protein
LSRTSLLSSPAPTETPTAAKVVVVVSICSKINCTKINVADGSSGGGQNGGGGGSQKVPYPSRSVEISKRLVSVSVSVEISTTPVSLDDQRFTHHRK